MKFSFKVSTNFPLVNFAVEVSHEFNKKVKEENRALDENVEFKAFEIRRVRYR